MKAMKLSLALVIILVSTSPAFSHFVKAALGFRLGYSPTEQGYGQKGYAASEKKGVGVQILNGINNGGWQGQQGGLQAAGSGYGAVGGRSLGGGPLDAHTGNSAVKHLRILGLNLYLGGRAAHGLGAGGAHKPPLAHKPIYNLVQHHQPQNYLSFLTKPVSLGASFGGLSKPVHAHAHNGGKIIGGQSGVRAAVGTPGFGLGFNLGYKQGINTKSPLGHIFGLGGHSGGGGGGKFFSPSFHKGPIYKGQDQVFIPGGGILKGHGHDVSHSPAIGGQSPFYGEFPHGFENSAVVSGLESKQHISTQPHPSNTRPQSHLQQQGQHSQASQHQPQKAIVAAKHQGLQALPSSYPRNPFLALFQRPSMMRPAPIHYTFNSPQSLPSGPVRMVLSPHPPTPAPQRPQGFAGSEASPAGWSTLFPMGAPQTAATNSFINPIPPNGQSLAKIHATLRPATSPYHQHHQSTPVTSAQHQAPFLHQGQTQSNQQSSYQGFYPQAVQSQTPFVQPVHHNPQANFQQFFTNGFQQQHASGAPQIGAQEFNPFQQGNLQTFQIPQANFQQGPLIPQQSPFYNQIQEQPVQAATPSVTHVKQPASNNFPNIPGLPFTADSMSFAPDPGFQYSHSTVSEPIKMGDFTMHMDMSNNGGSNNGGAEPSSASSNVPMYGPMGRRLKKTKKTQMPQARQDTIIIKKQGNAAENVSKARDMMEASASTNNIINSITLASSMGSTSWTPMVVADAPKLEKKSLDTKQVSSSAEQKVSNSRPVQTAVPSIIGSSSVISTGPSPSLGKQDRTMILRRRLNLNSAEALNTAPTVIPEMTSTVVASSTSAIPSSSSTSTSTTTTTTTTTSTTTPVPTSSSSSTTPNPPATSPESLSTSQSTVAPVTTTITVSV